jgi:hypothetical protein
MIEPENNDKDSESEPVDMSSVIKVVGVVVFGLLTVLGLSWMDLIGSNSKEGSSKKKATEAQSETKVVKNEEGEEVADYNEDYLEGDISEDDYANVPSK